jgi:hypothetical protein
MRKQKGLWFCEKNIKSCDGKNLLKIVLKFGKVVETRVWFERKQHFERRGSSG